MIKQKKTEVQTLILLKDKFEKESEARGWAKEHDFKSDKLDETEDSWRFRQFEPDACDSDSFKTIELEEGVSAVICKKKDSKKDITRAFKTKIRRKRILKDKVKENKFVNKIALALEDKLPK